MNKIIILILSLICLINLTNSQQLNGSQLEAAQNIFYLMNGYNTTNPCISNQYAYFGCQKDSPISVTYYVKYIQLQLNPSNPLPPTIDVDFTAFVNISNIYVYNGVNVRTLFSKLPTTVKTYNMYVEKFVAPVDENFVLPSGFISLSFDTCSIPIPAGLFGGQLKTLNVNNAAGSFALPSPIPLNNIEDIELPINHLSNWTPDQIASFPKLSIANFNILNDKTKPGYQPFNLPSFNFKNIRDLTIIFDSYASNHLKSTNTQESTVTASSDQYQLWEFDQTLNNPSIRSLNIYGIGFIQTTKFIDLSNLHIGANIDIIYADPFLNCTELPCIKTPLNAFLEIYGMSTDLLTIDYSNLRRFDYSDSTRSGQSLPTTFDFSRLDRVVITDSFIVGGIPNSYCQLFEYQLELNGNELTDIPSCYKCYGGAYGPINNYFFPNPFVGFNTSTPPSDCSTFSIDMSYNKVAKTDGSTVITINGVDFGWHVATAPNVQFVAQTHNAFDAPVMNVTIPNTQLELAIPQGVGSNLNYTFYFGLNNRFTVTFNYTYEVPVITGYTLGTLNDGTKVLIINGNGFDYNNPNIINVNNVDFEASNADIDQNGVFYTPDPQDLTPNTKLTVYTIVGGQKSNIIEFTIFSKLSLVAPTTKLNETGGSLTLTGEFSTATTSDVSVTINDVSCTVTSVTPTSITITYPSSSTFGVYPIVVSVGGQLLSSEVEIVQTPTPTPTPSTTGSTPTPTPTPSTTGSSSSTDDGSTSSTLSISITLFISCLILSTIF